MKLVYHRLLQQDLSGILRYYEGEGGSGLSDRFFREFENVIHKISENPNRFHITESTLRRANFPAFPYHILFRQGKDLIQILVLRHHKRHPHLGLRRR